MLLGEAGSGLDRLWELTGLGRRFGAFVVSWGRVPSDAADAADAADSDSATPA